MKEAQVQIIQGPEFIKHLTDAVLNTSFLEYIRMSGLGDTPLDKRAVMHILRVKSTNSIDRFCTTGKEDVMRVRHLLKRHFKKNRPYFLLIDVLEYKALPIW